MTDWDVIVIGGGPAGAAAATLLAREGRSVLVLERAHFPRHHIGESTILSIHSTLRWLGVDQKVAAAGFRRKTGATFIWGIDRVPWSIHFDEISARSPERLPYSYEIERDLFDQILLDHAKESGAQVTEGARVTDLVVEEGRVTGVVVDRGEGVARLTARVVIDASGQARLAGGRFRWQQRNPRLRNAALYGYWSGGPPRYELLGGDVTADDRSNILVCSTPFGWIWLIPQRGDRVSIGTVLCGGSGLSGDGRTTTERYLDLLGGCDDLRPVLAHLTLRNDEPVRAISDWSYRCSQMSAPGLFLTGDAACFVDPILSSGLHLALRGAISAACSTNSVLSGQGEGLIRHWYETVYRAAYGQFEEMALWWYHGDRNRDRWFQLSRDLIDPSSYGEDLTTRHAFVHVAAGMQPSPYVQVQVDDWPHRVWMSSLFHAHASYESQMDLLSRHFGVSERRPPTPLARGSRTDLPSGAVTGPYLRGDAKLLIEPDPERVRIRVSCVLPETRVDGTSLDVTELFPVLLRMDGKKPLRTIADEMGLGFESYAGLEKLVVELERLGALAGVMGGQEPDRHRVNADVAPTSVT